MSRRSFRNASEKWSSARGVEAMEEGAGEHLIFHQAHSKAFRPPLHSPDRHTYIHIFASSHSCAHADRWVQLLHTSLCLTYIFNHPHILYMTHTHARCKWRHAQVGFSTHCCTCAGQPQYAPQRFGSLTGARPRSEALIVAQESVHQDVDYELFRGWRLLWTNTQHYGSCSSDIWIPGFPLLPLHPHLHPTCANLLFREFLSGRIWSLTIHRNVNMAPLLIFWGSDPVLICSTGGVTTIHGFRTQL